MENFLNNLTVLNKQVNVFVWEQSGLYLLLAVGLLVTVITGFFQVSHLRHWWKQTVGSMFHKDVIGHDFEDKKSISPFQALCTALAATVGTGNIAGVAAAICVGGAGAVFWMWVAAFFGMMTNYAENVLGIYYRRRDAAGEWCGGAMYYLADGLGSKKGMKIPARILAIAFSVFAILASFGIGSMGQVNKIVLNIEAAFPIQSLVDTVVFGNVSLYALILGALITLLTALIVLGGLKRIAAVAEKAVPFMVVLYVVGALAIIVVNAGQILPALRAVFVNAFTPIAAIGGGMGVLIKKVVTEGCKRGVFSNEAGLGSSVMVHSNSTVKEPVQQGMWGIFEVFADTMVVCTMTALLILTSGVYNLSTGEALGSDATLVASAFNSVFSWGNIGQKFVALAMFLFAFTTVLGWDHYGSKAWEYLFGAKSVKLYKVLHIITVIFGAILSSSLAWDISDTFNGLMMIPNLIGVLALTPLVARITKNYVARILHGKKEKPILSYKDEA